MSVLVRLDACIAGVEAAHRRQNEVQIRDYCQRVGDLLAWAVALLDHLQQRGSSPSPGAATHCRALERWAQRIVENVNEANLLACDPRLEQSLSDLVTLLEDELSHLVKARPG